MAEDSGNTQARGVDCAGNPVESIRHMFVDIVQAGRIGRGQRPAERPVFLMQHGVAGGRFVVRPDLPEDLRVGLFGGGEYPAWVRFSSDTPGKSDWKTTIGIAIKLFGVPGSRLLGADVGDSESGDPGTFDFLLQNHDVFFVDTATDFCAFTRAAIIDGTFDAYLAEHPTTKTILDAMEKPVGSVLGSDYWSCLPFAFGPGRFVKYKLEPAEPVSPPTQQPEDPRQLRRDFEARIGAGEARFRFLAQFQTDPQAMPLDRATVPWQSPFVHLADLILPAQDPAAPGQAEYGANLAYNIWRVSEPHRPQGSLAEARRIAYESSAVLRHRTNAVPHEEPSEPRPLGSTATDAADREIVRAAIHPAIGIARVGDSKEGYFIGPETTTPPEREQGFYRDGDGALKRQAARFRIYGYNAQGQVVRELTAADAEIEWTVHVANRKAAWYQFIAALDLPESTGQPCPRRNPDAADRAALVIDPGPRSISGASQGGGAEHRFDTGRFKDVTVPLGEIRTDEDGRLVFLGGHGKSESPSGQPAYTSEIPNYFANAVDWYDDMSDGPVTASVRVGGRDLAADPAWVIVGPPNFAPDLLSWRTMHDLMTALFVESGDLPFPSPVRFSRHILPQLQRLSALQWVNKGFAALFGAGGPLDFSNQKLLRRLSANFAGVGKDDPNAELRRNLFNSFRPDGTIGLDPGLWPWIYGDAEGTFDTSTRINLSLPPYQAKLLQAWVAGNFVDDLDTAGAPPPDVEALPVGDQPAMLDEAALTYCAADAFHPGIEMTWPIRHRQLYAAPFRFAHRPSGSPEPDFGEVLTHEVAIGPDGPLGPLGPGDVTRWMALPWQVDTAGCRSGYDHAYDPFLPTFWPARVPNQVLTDGDYAKVMDEALPRAERLAAFYRRGDWEVLRYSPPDFNDFAMKMVRLFGQWGVVEKRPGPANDPDIPEILYVSYMGPETKPVRSAFTAMLGAAPPEPAAEGSLAEAGWRSEEQRRSFTEARFPNRR